MDNENIYVIDNYALATPGQRIIAGIIDLIIASVASLIVGAILSIIGLGYLGQIGGALYLLLRDSLPFLDYQSIGKKLINLKVLHKEEGKISFKTDVKRNFIFIPTFLNSFGIAFFYIGGAFTLLLLLIEVYQLYSDDDNQRLGDKFANTIVSQKD